MYIICDWIYGHRSKSQIGSYEIINFTPRIVSTRTTISLCLRASLVLVAAHRSSCQMRQKNLAGWTYKVVSGMFTSGGWWGMELAGKVYSTKWCYDMSEAQKPAWKGFAGSLMAEISKIYTVDARTAKTSSNTGYCQPRHSTVLKPSLELFTSL